VQIKAERNLFGRLLILSQQHDISLEKLFRYPLGPIPWSLAAADGGLVKTDKSKLMHHLETLAPVPDTPPIEVCIYIMDGNAHFQALVHLPDTFEELAVQVFHSLPKATVVHFVTDTYKDLSIKSLERNRKESSSTYLIGGAKTKLPKDFKTFLLNSDNKKQFIRLLKVEWQTSKYAHHLRGRKVFFVSDDECVCLESHDGQEVNSSLIQSLLSSQEEADTRIILHCLYASETATRDTQVIIRTPDTDALVILLYYSDSICQPLLMDTGTGNKRRLIDIHGIAGTLGPDLVKALPGLHAFSGSDCTSCFVKKGKLKPLKVLQQYPKFLDVFIRLGSTANSLSDADLQDLERFVCSLYGNEKCSGTNQLRCDIFKSRYNSNSSTKACSIENGVDLSLIPPCLSSLRMHCLRVNYQTFIWRHSHQAFSDIPSPVGNGWKMDDDGNLSIEWTDGDVLPQQLVDILASAEPKESSSVSSDISEFEPYEAFEEEVEEDCEFDNIIDIIFDDDQDD